VVCLRGRYCLAVQNFGISLELDMWFSAGFLLLRALPWWSSASLVLLCQATVVVVPPAQRMAST